MTEVYVMKINDIDWSKVPDILAKEQVRLLCHCSKRTALYYLKSGKLPCIYSGKKTRCYKIRKEDLMAFIEEYVSLPVSMFGKGDFYILRAKGDSMADAGIDEDDLLVIERNCPALEGDIVVALDEDNQNTLKRYAGYDEDSGYYILEYENEEQYPGKTIKLRSFQVQGVARHIIKSL